MSEHQGERMEFKKPADIDPDPTIREFFAAIGETIADVIKLRWQAFRARKNGGEPK